MLSSISWNEYLWVCGTAAIIYYLVVGWIYYRADIVKLIHQSGKENSRSSIENGEKEEHISLIQQYSLAEQIKKDIKELFASIPKGTISGQELLRICKERITGLSSLKDQGLKTAISNLVIQQSKINHNTDVSEEDLLVLWNNTSYSEEG